MKASIYTTAVLLALGLTACNEEMDNPLADGPVAAQVTAGISQTLTRVSVANDGSASFTNGDEINVVANGGATYVYTLQDNGTIWSAGNNPYYFQDRGTVSFQAWYAAPGYAETGNAIEINTKNQTVSSGWNQWDILATPVVVTDVSSPTVAFTGTDAFSHVMTQVTMVFKKGDGISDLAALKGYTLKKTTHRCHVQHAGLYADSGHNDRRYNHIRHQCIRRGIHLHLAHPRTADCYRHDSPRSHLQRSDL